MLAKRAIFSAVETRLLGRKPMVLTGLATIPISHNSGAREGTAATPPAVV